MMLPQPTTLVIATEFVLRALGSFGRRRLTFFAHPTIVDFPITPSISGEVTAQSQDIQNGRRGSKPRQEFAVWRKRRFYSKVEAQLSDRWIESKVTGPILSPLNPNR
jgi:hypothetical protein